MTAKICPHIVFIVILMVVFPFLLQSNVRREKRKKPDPPCVICNGSGRVDCHHCCGRGFSPLSLSHTYTHTTPPLKWLTGTCWCYSWNFWFRAFYLFSNWQLLCYRIEFISPIPLSNTSLCSKTREDKFCSPRNASKRGMAKMVWWLFCLWFLLSELKTL